MAEYTVLYNPLSNNKLGEKTAKKLLDFFPGDKLTFTDITQILDRKTYFEQAPEGMRFIIAGGDGTLSKFADSLLKAGAPIPENLLFFPAGSGNDFYKDVCGKNAEIKPIEVTKYLKKLPTVEIDGKISCFVNGIGFGIDGYACEEADNQRARSRKKINYTFIALKGLLGKYIPRLAKVTIDGNVYTLPYAWLCPTMNGKYFGGGMMPAPYQDRLNSERSITFMCYFDKSRIRTLLHFPRLFSGTFEVFGPKHVLLKSGYDITVEFNEPCALQIDGETVLNVKKYRCRSYAPES